MAFDTVGIGFGNGQQDSSSQGWTLVTETTLTEAAQTLDIPIDGETSGALHLIASIPYGGSEARDYTLRLNEADVACASSANQHIQWFGTTLQTGVTSGGVIAGSLGTGNANTIIDAIFPNPTASVGERMIMSSAKFGTLIAGRQDKLMKLTTPTDATAITHIGIGCTVTAGLGVGTVLRLFRSTP